MPKVGMEPIRRDALVKATIAEIGAAQSLDVGFPRRLFWHLRGRNQWLA